MDNYVPEEKRQRKKTSLDPPTCPICGITLRENELIAHYENELEKLSKIKRIIAKSPQTSPTSSVKNRDNDNCAGSSSSNKVESAENCWSTFQKIKENRSRRTSKNKNRKRKVEDKACPICFKPVVNEDLQLHVEQCIKKQENRSNSDESDDDDEIDVGETYSWCGQTRIRATSLIEGNLSSAGIGICITKTNDEDEMVNIDGDDETYGQNQYSEHDIILLNKEDERLHDLVASGTAESPSTSSSIRENREENNQNVANSVSSSPTSFLEKMEVDCDKTNNGDIQQSDPEVIIESLKAKIREFEKRIVRNRPKCLICLSPEFEVPVVSVSCWHVYCEKCWLATLGAKKLCPQCSMITAAADLRRIYL